MVESRKKEKTVSSGSIIQEAISIAIKENDYGLRLLALRDICQALSKAGEIEKALDMVKEMGKLSVFLNSETVSEERTFALSNISKALVEIGEMERAKEITKEVLRIAEGSGGEAPGNICGVLARIGEVEKALDIVEEVNEVILPSALSGISEQLIKIGKIEKAKEVLIKALDAARIISSDIYRISALSDVSVALAKAGELEKAKRVIEDALGIAVEVHDRTKYDTSHVFALLDVVEALAGIGEIERALDIAKEVNLNRARVHAFSNISEALIKDRKIEKAKQIIKEALNITKRLSVDWVRSVALSKIYVALRLIEQAQGPISVDMEEEPKKEEQPKKRGFFKKLFG